MENYVKIGKTGLIQMKRGKTEKPGKIGKVG